MKPREKAEELMVKFSHHTMSKYDDKQCALIAVEEILKVVEDNNLEYDDNYWEEVKSELNKM